MSPNEDAQYLQVLVEPKEIHLQMLAFQAGLLPTCSEGLPQRK